MIGHNKYLDLIGYLKENGFANRECIAKLCELDVAQAEQLTTNLLKLGAPFLLMNGSLALDEANIQEPLLLESILKNIDEEIDAELHLLLHTPSTNHYIKELALSGASIVALSECQTAGVGRSGKHWVSPFGSNIYFSLRRKIKTPLHHISPLSLIVGLAVIETLNQFGLNELKLKWPNDIYFDDRKLSGVLIEVVKHNKEFVDVIVGIGINLKLNLTDASGIDQKWIDIYSIKPDDRISRNEIISTLINTLDSFINRFEHVGFNDFRKAWQKVDYLFGKEVYTKGMRENSSGIAMGVAPWGELLIQSGADLIKISSGEVSVRLS